MGTNLARVKDYNAVVVLDLVRSGGPIGRPVIAAATGLTLQTVSNIVRRLLAAGAVVEEPVESSGRARRVLRVNPDAGFAVGIHLRTGLAVGVVDLAGSVRGRAETTFALEEPPAGVLDASATSWPRRWRRPASRASACSAPESALPGRWTCAGASC